MVNFGSLLLADLGSGAVAGIAIAVFVVGAALAAFVTWQVLKIVSKKKAEKKLDETSRRVEQMLKEAETACKQLKQETILEAKEQELKRRNEFEQEMKE